MARAVLQRSLDEGSDEMYQRLKICALALAAATGPATGFAQTLPVGATAFTCPFQVTMPQPSERKGYTDKGIFIEMHKAGDSLLTARCSANSIDMAMEDVLAILREGAVNAGEQHVRATAIRTPLGMQFTITSVREPYNSQERCTVGPKAMMCLSVLSPVGQPAPSIVPAFFASLRGPVTNPIPGPSRAWVALGRSSWLDVVGAEWKERVSGWILTDLDEPDQAGAMSYLVRYEADCVGKRLRMLTSASYPRRHADGATMAAYEVEDRTWRPFVVDTIGERIGSSLCMYAEMARRKAEGAPGTPH
jgi:hypothetical protein